MKKIIVSVTNDLLADNRVHKVCTTLTAMGFSVLLIGRRYRNSVRLAPRVYKTQRFLLLFRKGPLFYAEYNVRLFFFLLFRKFDLLLSNDLDTLTANYFASQFHKKPLVYDSHEYFTEVPELFNRPRTRQIWESLERKMVPKVTAAYTVCKSIADVYSQKYKIPFKVVRNLPFTGSAENIPAEKLITEHRKIIIYQGAINKGRGLEQTIRAMQYLDNALLILAGAGDIEVQLKQMTDELQLKNVVFAGRLPLEELRFLTRQASVGISVEEDLGLNYHYALPNKLFDYIQAHIPVVVSNLPEMRYVVEHYQFGLVAESLNPEALAKTLNKALTDEILRLQWAENIEIAAKKLTWEIEEAVVKEIFRPFL